MYNILEVKNLTKKYGDFTALDDVSLSIPEGTIYGLLGPNGAGKTTLIRIINQIIGPDTGEVLFDGQPLRRRNIADIGYMPEERGLYKKMKVGEELIYLARLKGMNKADARKEIDKWFRSFETTGWWEKKVESLSKGMAQKLQLIATVLHKPKFLILDEPFSGFDPINTELIKNKIKELKEQGTTILLSTHRMDSVEALCDSITLINKARKIVDGPVREIKENFKSNIFEVILKGMVNEDDLELPPAYNLTSIQHKEQANRTFLQFRINQNGGANNLLKSIIQKHEIFSFQEILPTINDIFIKTVKEQDK